MVTGKWNCHTAPIVARLQILSLYNINKFPSCSFVYKSFNNLLPPQFSTLFTLNKDVHDHNTRHKNNIHQISYHIDVRARNMKVYGPKVWNSLPLFIYRTCGRISLFKKRCKS